MQRRSGTQAASQHEERSADAKGVDGGKVESDRVRDAGRAVGAVGAVGAAGGSWGRRGGAGAGGGGGQATRPYKREQNASARGTFGLSDQKGMISTPWSSLVICKISEVIIDSRAWRRRRVPGRAWACLGVRLRALQMGVGGGAGWQRSRTLGAVRT